MNLRSCSLALLSACLPSVPTLAANGLLGHDSVALTGGYVWSDSAGASYDGGTVTLEGRSNAVSPEAAGMGIDLDLGASYLRAAYDHSPSHIDSWTAGGGVTLFYDNRGPVSPFVRVGLGYASSRVQHVSDESYLWSASAGFELYLRPGISLMPEVRYTGFPNLSSGHTTGYSLTLSLEVMRGVNALFAAAYETSGGYDATSITGGFFLSY